MSKDMVILNDREEGLMSVSQEEEYENYKHALKKAWSMILKIKFK
ncbi:hypothetical protein [Borrelia miyamotoi]